MAEYKFTGTYPRAMFGLAHGVNARVTPAAETRHITEGSTVVLEPGDLLSTDEPYEHAELVDLTDAPYEPPADEADTEPPAEDPAEDEPPTQPAKRGTKA